MPIAIEINEALGVLFLRAEGEISDQDLISAVRGGFADKRFHPELRMLSDHSNADFSKLTSDGMRVVAGLNKFSPTARRAVLLRGPLQAGMSRVLDSYHLVQGKATYGYFHDRSEALKYLNEGFPPEKHIQ